MPGFRRAAQGRGPTVDRTKTQRVVWKHANGPITFQFLGRTGELSGAPTDEMTNFRTGSPNRRIRESEATADQKCEIEAEAGRVLD